MKRLERPHMIYYWSAKLFQIGSPHWVHHVHNHGLNGTKGQQRHCAMPNRMNDSRPKLWSNGISPSSFGNNCNSQKAIHYWQQYAAYKSSSIFPGFLILKKASERVPPTKIMPRQWTWVRILESILYSRSNCFLVLAVLNAVSFFWSHSIH